MRIVIVVDANVILSALLGGKPSSILFDGRFHFVSTRFTINEVRKYLPRLAKKLSITPNKLETLLGKLPVLVYGRTFYKEKLKEAEKMIGNIDKKDIEILALALMLETYLWSQDRDFDECGYQKVLKTYHFI